MKLSSGSRNRSDANPQCCTKLKELFQRWHEGLNELRVALLAGDRSRRAKRDRRAVYGPERAAADQLTPLVDEGPEPVAAAPLTTDGETDERQVTRSLDDRSQALAEVCARLLEDLDGEEVRAAEIRFVVHKHDHPGRPRLDPASADRVSDGELVLELRRLLAWSGGAIADVARALETRGAELDESAREFLREEIEALDADVQTLNVYVAEPINWDSEFGCLLSGEVAPFDDLPGDEDDETD
ncbi:MAG TPA: hypothetical protein VME22_28720 [Solirubrobacteraceae bacterium]|nr:hypothetical protein [Solirubrobacteraceae bacterium]